MAIVFPDWKGLIKPKNYEVMKAKAKWIGGQAFVSSADSGHLTIMDSSTEDEPQRANSPTELFLQAMLGCTGIDVISDLQKMRQEVKGLEITATGTRAQEAPKVFTEIDVEYVVYGDVDKDKLERAINLSQEKYCNISITLKRAGTKINVTSRVEKP